MINAIFGLFLIFLSTSVRGQHADFGPSQAYRDAFFANRATRHYEDNVIQQLDQFLSLNWASVDSVSPACLQDVKLIVQSNETWAKMCKEQKFPKQNGNVLLFPSQI